MDLRKFDVVARYSSTEALIKAIKDDVRTALNDVKRVVKYTGADRGSIFRFSYNVDAGELKILTFRSLNPDLRNDGGEYDYFYTYSQVREGVTEVQSWSCTIEPLEPAWVKPRLYVGASLKDAIKAIPEMDLEV